FSKLLADQNIINPQIIKEKITTALLALCFRDSHVLVQFWSPVIVRKRCLLTTLDQPFGLGVVDEALYLYRLESEQRMFVVDGGHREELGPPGRVYRQKLPEWGLNAHTLPDSAACHNTHGYLNLPVFEPDSGCCVGVLELVTSSNYVDYAFEVQEVSRALKVVDEENLKCPNLYEDPTFYTQVGDERRQIELDEIFFALKAICNVHDIPLAQTWALSGYGSAVAISGNLEQTCSSFNGNCIGKVCMSTYGLPFYIRALSMWGFHEDCRERHLDKSQGVVGRSLSSCGLCFCEDVTKLGEDEYPLAAYAHLNGITSCLAIYVKSIERDAEYVIELVLPPHNTNEADLQSLMKTVKQQINNASSLKLGIVSSLQVIGGDHLNWNFESPPSPITILTEQEEVLPEPGKQPLLENDRDDDDDVRFSKDQSVIAYLEHIEDDILNSEPSDSAADGTSQSVVPCLDAGAEDSNINKGKMKRKRKRSEKSISLEEISKHYGKTINEAAKNLSVSRSTLKRICRSYGILRWPYKSGSDKSNSLLKSNQTDVVAVHASEGLTPIVEASSEPLVTTNASHDHTIPTEHGKQSSTLVLHQQEQTNLTAGSAQLETSTKDQFIGNTTATNILKNLTIKATHEDNTVRFLFTISDGLVKLKELIATRFQLSLGSFRLKYEDTDGDMILVACDSDLMGSVGETRQPGNQSVIRLFVLPVHQSPDA
ncbi:PB1 domain, RWP-RK domain, lambda repressor-like, DNA-binding domain protein, partial [Tanacetum coccineum]